jgi:hypothetical protein
MYFFLPGQRRRKDYFPSLIYYFANPDSIKAYKKKDKAEEDFWKSEEEEKEDDKPLQEVSKIQR